MEASAWSSGLTYVATTGIGIATVNPVMMATGSVGLMGWLIDRWQEGKRNPSPANRPSATVREQINSVSRFEPSPEWFQEEASQRAPTRQSDEAIVRRRAAEIARSPNKGTDFDNWIRAVIELKITQRAAQIARSPNAGSDFQNWLRAEHELKVAQRAEEIASSPEAGTDYDNWVRAEHDVDVAQRAEKIAHSQRAGDDKANWYRAERELAAEHTAITKRADAIARSPQTATEIRTHAEITLRAEDIARSNRGGTDFDNWIRAEAQYKTYRARLDKCAQGIAASPEAALGHWLKAQQELQAGGRIPPR
jgi:hypothetical protein